jgi:hypothetical protein
MKTAIYILVFANLAFFAWANWIDVPLRASAAQSISGLPQLALATDAPAAKTKNAAVARTGAAAARCVSVGPFNTSERAANASSLLRERGLDPKQREEQGETWDGYWVYVGGLRTALDQARVLHTLEEAGLNDARVMPESSAPERRISVGLFSERIRAERRARVLQRLGLKPEIGERRVPGAVYWLDINLAPNESTLSTEGLLSAEETGARLEVRVCPAVQSAPAPG